MTFVALSIAKRRWTVDADGEYSDFRRPWLNAPTDVGRPCDTNRRGVARDARVATGARCSS